MPESFEVQRDGDKTIRFSGRLIAETGSSWDRASSDYSGSPGRRATLRLYQTEAGTYICERVEETQHDREVNRFFGGVCPRVEHIFDFFGAGRWAKDLYRKAKLAYVENVE